MNAKNLFTLCALVLAIVLRTGIGMGSQESGSEARPSQPFQKIRAAYWGIKSLKHADRQFDLLHAHGINTGLVKYGQLLLNERLLQAWGDKARQYQIRFLPVLNFAGQDELKEFHGRFRHYIDRYGQEFPSTPCPLDEKYWHVMIGQRFEQLARLSHVSGIAGGVFDTEMYGSDFNIFYDVCFCEVCWGNFTFVEYKHIHDVEKNQRFESLIQHDLYNQYMAFQEKRLQDILIGIRKPIFDINPDFFIGILAFQRNWFYRALIQGLGTAEAPVAVFSETSYVLGFTSYIAREREFIKGIRNTDRLRSAEEDALPIAQYVPGLWMGRFFPEEIPSQLYHLALNTDGYWLYNVDSLWNAEPPEPPQYALHGSHTEYWTGIEFANEKLRQSEVTPHAELAPLYPSSFFWTSQKHFVSPPSLEFFLRHIALSYNKSHSSPRQKSVTYRGRTLFHGIHSTEGTMTIHHVSLAKYTEPTQYIIFNHNGQIWQQGILDTQRPVVTLKLQTESPEIFSLFLDSGSNAARVSFSGITYVVEASSTFPLSTIHTPHLYTVYVKPGQHALKVRGHCGGQERALIKIFSPDNRLQQHYKIRGFVEIKIPIDVYSHATPNDVSRKASDMLIGSSNFWKISVEPISSMSFEDVEFYLLNQEFPYLFVE